MTFLDTNILVYSVDGNELVKQPIASAIVAHAIDRGGFLVSAQVLNEFSNIGLLKLKLAVSEVREFVAMFSRIPNVPLAAAWTDRALQIKSRYGIQFFDSLILAAAEANGCDEILTEDLADGHVYCGVRAVNPFK